MTPNTQDEDELSEPYLSIVKEKEPDQFIDLLCANNFFAGNLNGKMPVNENRVVFELWLKEREQSIKEQAEREALEGLLDWQDQEFDIDNRPVGEAYYVIQGDAREAIEMLLHSTNNSLEEKI